MYTTGSSQRYFFALLLVVFSGLFLWLISPYLLTVLWALTLATVSYPLFSLLQTRFRMPAALAALVTTLGLVLCVVLPVFGLVQLLGGEVSAVTQAIQNPSTKTHVMNVLSSPTADTLLSITGMTSTELVQKVVAVVETGSGTIATHVLSLGTGAFGFTIKLIITFYLLYFLLKDGRKFTEVLLQHTPLSRTQAVHLFQNFTSTVRALIKGSLIVALLQGLAGALLFTVAGVPNPLLWGTVMIFMALIPAAGPALVWAPAALYMYATGHGTAALCIALVGGLGIGMLDNLLRPVLVGRDTAMPDPLILLSILGGIGAFGPSGIILGPVVTSLFLALWKQFAEAQAQGIGQSESA
jgi:predicted PurR-regulated permease PerM